MCDDMLISHVVLFITLCSVRYELDLRSYLCSLVMRDDVLISHVVLFITLCRVRYEIWSKLKSVYYFVLFVTKICVRGKEIFQTYITGSLTIVSAYVPGLNGYNLDTAALAVDYRSVGFRECVAEVARYMVTVEGMDIQDPLRLRLLSHLQCYSAQREAAAKASLSNMSNSSWGGHNPHSSVHHAAGGGQYHQQGGAMGSASSMSMISQHAAAAAQATEHGMATGLYSSDPTSRHMSSATGASSQTHVDATNMGMRLPATGTVAPQMPSSGSSAGQVTPSVLSGLSHSQFPVGFSMNSMPMLSPSGTHYSSASSSLGKPYRPWGAELAY